MNQNVCFYHRSSLSFGIKILALPLPHIEDTLLLHGASTHTPQTILYRCRYQHVTSGLREWPVT